MGVGASLGTELPEGPTALGQRKRQGQDVCSLILTLSGLQPSREGRTHGLEALTLPFGALIDGWPLEATCPLFCATPGRTAGWTPTHI